jgi:multiple antibiotic resistance protein
MPRICLDLIADPGRQSQLKSASQGRFLCRYFSYLFDLFDTSHGVDRRRARGPVKPAAIAPRGGTHYLRSMSLDYALSAFVTLLVIVDPAGLAAIFIGVTEGLSTKERRSVGLRASVIAGAILIGTALIGDQLLRRLGIGLPAFQIAGGLLLFWIAADMVYGTRTERDSRTAEEVADEHIRNIAAFPLAIPMMAGPGAIAATVLLSGRAPNALALVALIGVIVAVCAITMLTFLFALPIKRALGVTGNIVLARLLGVILAALAVQYVIDGVRSVLKS